MTALFVVIGIAAFAIFLTVALIGGNKRDLSQGTGDSPRYSCVRCEMPYSIPDVPMRCRVCGGMVDKLS